MKCEVYDWDKDKYCSLAATYKCNQCGMLVCEKHYDEFWGECPDCPPPQFIKIKKKVIK